MKITVEFEFPDTLYDRIPDEILFANIDRSFPVSCVTHRIINRIVGKVSFDSLEESVCRFVGCSINEMQSISRKGLGITARKLCHHISYNLHIASLTKIGERFGNKDHATVLHSNRKVIEFLKTDILFRKQYEIFIESFTNKTYSK
jgi:chromosomal replication initiation ATPase DnaA